MSGFPAKAVRLKPTDHSKWIRVTIHLRRRPGHDPIPSYESFIGCPPRPRLSNEEFARRYGAHQDDIDKVADHCRLQGLTVISDHAARRHVVVEGSVGHFNRAFSVTIHDHKKGDHLYHAPEREAVVPDHLSGIIVHAGLGHEPPDPCVVNVTNQPPNTPGDGNTGLITPAIYGSLAGWPTGGANGQTIAVLIFAPPFGFSMADVQSTFTTLWNLPVPTVVTISIDSTPVDIITPNGEWNSDVCIASAFAIGATIAVYYGSNQLDTYPRIIHPSPGDPICSVTTSSGSYYDEITPYVNFPSVAAALQIIYEDAAIQGVTICLPTGDYGSGANVGDGKDHCSGNNHPLTLTVGGTIAGSISGNNFVEWLANYGSALGDANFRVGGGGGVSIYQPLPSYQANSNVPPSTNSGTIGRGIPDVATVYGAEFTMYLNGVSSATSGGTSQSCPMTAGLIASINAAIGRNVGFINPTLYSQPSNLVRDLNPTNTVGGPQSNSNGSWVDSNNVIHYTPVPGYPVTNGWDACTGLGVIKGNALVTYLRSTAELPYLLGVSLAPVTLYLNAPVGSLVGTLHVSCSLGTTFSGTLSLGPNASPFLHIVGNTLVTSVGFNVPGNYTADIIVTQSGLGGSPLTQFVPFTVTPSYVGTKAPNGQFWLLRDDGLGAGQSVANAYLTLPTGKLYWDWLFYQSPVVFATPGPVTSIVKTTATPTSVTISWAAPTTGQSPFTYHVFYSLIATGPWTQVGGTITNTNFTVTGLGELPGPVSGVTGGNITSSSVTVGWNAATGLPQNYWFSVVAIGPDDLLSGPTTIAGPFTTT